MSNEILTMTGVRIVARTEDGEIKTLVDGVDLALQRGEMLGLIGESGAGKTTIGLAALAYMRSGCAIVGGEIHFDGADLRRLSRNGRRNLRGRRIAYVAQSAAASFNPSKTLMNQVCEMPIRHGLMSRKEAEEQAMTLFHELDLPLPEEFGDRYPHQVSGGQLQRAMLAMAMSCRPDILVFDEPTTALDVTTQIEALVAIRKLVTNYGTAGLYISHDLAVVAQIADRILVLRNGREVETGTTEKIIHHPAEQYTQALVSVRNDHALGTRDSAVCREDDPVLSLHHVVARYGALRAVDDVSIEVRPREFVAVVGESGSGKSSLARVICGLKPRENGDVRFRGHSLPAAVSERETDQLRRIQLIYQSPDAALNPRQTIAEVIGRPIKFYFGLSKVEIASKTEELLQLVRLPAEFGRRYPDELSGGQKQRVCIARALAAEPDVLICDEVTAALDPLLADEILSLLKRLQAERGIGCLFITHDLGLVRRIADTVVIMLRGKVVASGPLGQVFSPPLDPYTQRLLSSVPEMRKTWLAEVLAQRAAGQEATL